MSILEYLSKSFDRLEHVHMLKSTGESSMIKRVPGQFNSIFLFEVVRFSFFLIVYFLAFSFFSDKEVYQI